MVGVGSRTQFLRAESHYFYQFANQLLRHWLKATKFSANKRVRCGGAISRLWINFTANRCNLLLKERTETVRKFTVKNVIGKNSTFAKACQKTVYSLSAATYQHRYYYASVVFYGCSEVHFKKEIKKSLHRRAGKLILPDPSPSTDQNVSALGILSLPQQLTMRKYLCLKLFIIIAKARLA